MGMRSGTLAPDAGHAAVSDSRSRGTGSVPSALRYLAVADQLLT